MRVLHIIPHVHLGGADICAIQLVRALNERTAVEARLCVFQGGRAPSERLEGLRDPVLLDFAGSHWNLSEYLKFRRMIRALVADWKPDVIHCHLWPACRWAGMALVDVNVCHVWHIHDTRAWLQSENLRDQALRLWTRWLLKRLNPVLLAVSTAAGTYTKRSLGWRSAQFHRMPCAVDTQRFRPQPDPANLVPVIGMAAQFRPEKGHNIFLRALSQLADRGIHPHVLLAGDGETLEVTRNLCSSLNLKHVEFLGHVTDMPAFLSRIDLFVLPSTRFEGLPLSILEAMSVGIPVVATDVGGTGEVVIGDETGLLVRPGDSNELAAALQRAIETPDAMKRLAANARQIVMADYSRETNASCIEAIYREHLLFGRHPLFPQADAR